MWEIQQKQLKSRQDFEKEQTIIDSKICAQLFATHTILLAISSFVPQFEIIGALGEVLIFPVKMKSRGEASPVFFESSAAGG